MAGYYYRQLDREKRAVYDAMRTGMEALAPGIRVPKLTGQELSDIYLPLALAAAAAGADGLMVEVHDRPACALSDGAQALSCDQFDALARQVRQLLPHAYR